MKHKNSDVIKAWADGAEIEHRLESGICQITNFPSCNSDNAYRVKEVKNKVTWHQMYDNNFVGHPRHSRDDLAKSGYILRLETNNSEPGSFVLVSATLEKL